MYLDTLMVHPSITRSWKPARDSAPLVLSVPSDGPPADASIYPVYWVSYTILLTFALDGSRGSVFGFPPVFS